MLPVPLRDLFEVYANPVTDFEAILEVPFMRLQVELIQQKLLLNVVFALAATFGPIQHTFFCSIGILFFIEFCDFEFALRLFFLLLKQNCNQFRNLFLWWRIVDVKS